MLCSCNDLSLGCSLNTIIIIINYVWPRWQIQHLRNSLSQYQVSQCLTIFQYSFLFIIFQPNIEKWKFRPQNEAPLCYKSTTVFVLLQVFVNWYISYRNCENIEEIYFLSAQKSWSMSSVSEVIVHCVYRVWKSARVFYQYV